MPHYWGKDVTYDLFIPKPDPKDGYEDLVLVTDAPTIYVFDEQPNRTDALAMAVLIKTS